MGVSYFIPAQRGKSKSKLMKPGFILFLQALFLQTIYP